MHRRGLKTEKFAQELQKALRQKFKTASIFVSSSVLKKDGEKQPCSLIAVIDRSRRGHRPPKAYLDFAEGFWTAKQPKSKCEIVRPVDPKHRL